MENVFRLFSELLEKRIQSGVFTTEDSVRYLFFHALVDSGYCFLEDVVVEAPHPTLRGKKIDLFITQHQDQPSVAIEFKYDRAIPSEKNQPRSMRAGAVFKDIFKLANIPRSQAQYKYFIYFTDQEMATYFQNPGNGLVGWFDLLNDHNLIIDENLIRQRSQTFRDVVGKDIVPCSLKIAYNHELEKRNYLRVYEVN